MRRPAIIVALWLVVGCQAAPAPQVIYVTPAPASAAPSPSPSNVVQRSPPSSPSAATVAGYMVTVTPCTFDLAKDKDCQDQAFHVTNPVTQGGRVNLTVTVKNGGRKPSPPLSIMDLSDERTYGLGQFMPDYLKFVRCNGCKSRTVSDTTTYEFQWPPLAAGATRDLVVTFTAAGSPGYYNWYIYLATETMDAMDKGIFDVGGDPQKVGEWNAQTVIDIK